MIILSTHSFSAEEDREVMGRESHGGNELAFEFKRLGRKAINQLQRYRSNIPKDELDYRLIYSVLNSLELQITTEPIYIQRGDNRQLSTAINFRNDAGTPIVRLDKYSWGSITSETSKMALVLHEILCLAGYEKTYNYRYSSAIAFNVSSKSDIEKSGLVTCLDAYASSVLAVELKGLWKLTETEATYNFTSSDNRLHLILSYNPKASSIQQVYKCRLNEHYERKLFKVSGLFYEYSVEADVLSIKQYTGITPTVSKPLTLRRAKIVFK